MRTLSAAFVTIAVLMLVGCSDEPPVTSSPPPSGSTPPAELEPVSLRFDGDDPLTGDPSVEITVSTGRGGAVQKGTSWDGSPALRFPTFSADQPGLAVLSMLPAPDAGDVFSPGTDDFEFGVDFSMDPVSEGGVDNGNNLIQRGLFEDGAQYKLQLDHGRLSCRVQGSEAVTLVKTREPMLPDTWYRARCVVEDGTLTLRVAELADNGPGRWQELGSGSAAGEVSFPATTPLSVGGKLSPEGAVVPDDSDQFNGLLDNFYFSVGAVQG